MDRDIGKKVNREMYNFVYFRSNVQTLNDPHAAFCHYENIVN